MIHVLLASIVPLALFFTAWWRRGKRTGAKELVLLAIGCAISGAWAVAPDMPRLWGNLELYVDLHHKPYCNMWWLHCAIDARDDIDSSMLFPALFVLAAAAVVAVAWRELRALERERGGGRGWAGEEEQRRRREGG